MALWRFFLYFAITTTAVRVWTFWNNREVPIVNAPAGDIGGALFKSRKGRDIFAYKGIPYVQPPIGPLKFKKPVPFDSPAWTGVFDGTKGVTVCPQPTGIPLMPYQGHEDCLQLNVYVPDTDKPSPNGFPVMVWFHGGGFYSGDSSERFYGPGHLLDKDVILVTVNYRLGVYGFLNLGTEDISGNQGMWDQHEALKWVQNNIQAFQGNPNQVTIFGESAGGWSVSYHLTSRKSQGLFQAAIIQSGGLEVGGLKIDQFRSIVDLHRDYVEEVGCSFKDNDNIHDCLSSKSTKELYASAKMFDQCNTVTAVEAAFPVIWAPSDDFNIIDDPFFAKNPRQVLEDGDFVKVPVMLGATRDEGLLHTASMISDPAVFEDFKTYWEVCYANSFLEQYFVEEPIPDPLLKKIHQVHDFYFASNGDWTFTNLTHLFTDPGWLLSAERLAHQLSKKSNTYYYHFEHVGSFSAGDIFSQGKLGFLWTLLKKFVGVHETKSLGVSHADDILYLFDKIFPVTLLPDERDQEMIDFLVELWTNFAIFHNPTPDDNSWPMYGTNGHTYVRLDNSEINTSHNPQVDERMNFWKKMFEINI